MKDPLSKNPKIATPFELFKMAEAYYLGNLVKQDLNKALELWPQAAENGHPLSQYRLAMFYRDGQVVEANLEESFKWLTKAAKLGYPEARFALGEAYESGQPYGEQNQVEAVGWYLKAVENRLAAAQLKVGNLHSTENGLEKNPELAFQYYQLATGQGEVSA
ncbi:MAG: sel1 repeat family protein [Deltaproteobacteria bacterium]|jgi:TPR repeat protein|nr:sel1 repeat family protein [Deltaproteobacteria bacterium]